MNEIERAINTLKDIKRFEIPYGRLWKMCEVSISALEKQIPKKASGVGVASEYGYEGNNFICGCCPSCFKRHIISDYCEDCGQKLNWSVEECINKLCKMGGFL